MKDKIGENGLIPPERVRLLEIDQTCQGTFWECQHSVKIVLVDGTEKVNLLNGYEISPLIHSIASSHIINPIGLGHFALDPKTVLANFFFSEEEKQPKTFSKEDSHEEAMKLFFGEA